eukprot:Selendium_serpulae@DN1932_c0_g1_i1.p1
MKGTRHLGIFIFLAAATTLSSAFDIDGRQFWAQDGLNTHSYIQGYRQAAGDIRAEVIEALRDGTVQSFMTSIINIDINAPIEAAVFGDDGQIVQLDSPFILNSLLQADMAALTNPVGPLPTGVQELIVDVMPIDIMPLMPIAPPVIDNPHILCLACERLCNSLVFTSESAFATEAAVECARCVSLCVPLEAPVRNADLVTALQSNSEADVIGAVAQILQMETAKETILDLIGHDNGVPPVAGSTPEDACRLCEELCMTAIVTQGVSPPACDRCFMACGLPAPRVVDDTPDDVCHLCEALCPIAINSGVVPPECERCLMFCGGQDATAQSEPQDACELCEALCPIAINSGVLAPECERCFMFCGGPDYSTAQSEPQ